MDIIAFNEASTANGRIESFIENPDSASGIVTVPKTIASGETVTIPAGRVAILPNVQIDGVLNVEGEVFIPSGATLGDLDAQLALKADTSYVNTQLGLKANTADLKEIGVGQTCQDVTANRVAGTTYTNSTGKPIFVRLEFDLVTGGAIAYIIINGLSGGNAAANSTRGSISFIVPNGSTYSYAGTCPIAKWHELR